MKEGSGFRHSGVGTQKPFDERMRHRQRDAQETVQMSAREPITKKRVPNRNTAQRDKNHRG